MKKTIRRIVRKLTGNACGQAWLERMTQHLLHLQGLGCATDIAPLKTLLNKPNPLIFDVGANKGQYLGLIQAVLQSKEFVCHSFEPVSTSFKKLQAQAQGDSRVHTHNLALSNNNGESLIHFDKDESELASLSKRDLRCFDIDFEKSETIQTRKLEDFCAEHAIERIDLLKLDVEGHEFSVLNGAKRCFQEKRIKSVTFEFGGASIDSRVFLRDFWYWFETYEMDLYRITPSGYMHRLTEYREEYEHFRTTNYFASLRS